MQLLTINEAAEVAGKSIQTIRRMIKQKKIHVKKQKTPQGFNYLISKESLMSFLNESRYDENREHRPIQEPTQNTFESEIHHLTMTMQKLIDQDEKDKENFFNLIKTFQDRNAVLEERIKLLDAPKPKRWRFWRRVR